MERLIEKDQDLAWIKGHLSDSCTEMCEEVSGECWRCDIMVCMERLADYEDAEERGRLVEIPANYKDAVFSLDLPHLHISQLEFYGMELMAIGSEDESRYIIAGKNGCTEYFNAEHIGETIFFSNEEAEAKLKEMEADNG